ncbi:hypothetical protein SmJEL517_g03082 [Synchytrium microbalum]|uniref:B30.2/SPRY domain-containing protein n=1 Tax=Synchytrium microbalum TaxID=1806994 RepID=A0A507C3I6_9FUNG|nr:uncharacterized protein SmJEL517_g03082 [Synchytrium microbalum]TPX34232.1 hypothetical protein SmJEL517_g03082 [Synchytrium microbalum]
MTNFSNQGTAPSGGASALTVALVSNNRQRFPPTIPPSSNPTNATTSTLHSSDPTSTRPMRAHMLKPPHVPSYLTDSPIASNVVIEGDLSILEFQLPTVWSVKERNSMLELERGNLRVAYKGSGKSDSDAAAIRSNYPMPPQSGIFYYEIEIINKGRDGYIGIGFSIADVSTQRLPGWEKNSWGYHGDDGHSFSCSGTGKSYGPTFTTGDVIGCGVNFTNMTAFFTKNGVALGTAFTGLKGQLYPSVGLRTPGEIVEANFGGQPFKFDIDHYYKEEKSRLWSSINSLPMPPVSLSPNDSATNGASSAMDEDKDDGKPSTSSKPKTLPSTPASPNDLILQYLIHHGFAETAQAFHSSAYAGRQSASIPPPSSSLQPTTPLIPTNITPTPLQDDTHMKDRSRIRDAVLSGNLDVASELVTSLFPKAWVVGDRDIGFKVRLRKFMEVVRAALPPPSNTTIAVAATSDDTTTHMSVDDDIDDSMDDRMDIDDDNSVGVVQQQQETSNGHMNGNSKGKERAADKSPSTTQRGKWRQVLRLGQELQAEFGESGGQERIEALQEAYSLVAYPDPYHSPVSHLLDPMGRVPVANALNSAILASLGQPAVPSLETLYRQAEVVVDTLVHSGVGAAAFINVEKDCL